MILITTYKRPEMLLRLLKELQGENIVVFDDGSSYNPWEHKQYCTQYFRHPHWGKKGFWSTWQKMFNVARKSSDDEFIFLQDDLHDVDLNAIRVPGLPEKHVLNVINVGPDRHWTPNGTYCDCNFKTNRATLDAINWQIPPVPLTRWKNNPNMSSGVGHKLSQKFYRLGIPMLMPEVNYASHGDHASLMHPNERLKNKLICKTGN